MRERSSHKRMASTFCSSSRRTLAEATHILYVFPRGIMVNSVLSSQPTRSLILQALAEGGKAKLEPRHPTFTSDVMPSRSRQATMPCLHSTYHLLFPLSYILFSSNRPPERFYALIIDESCRAWLSLLGRT